MFWSIVAALLFVMCLPFIIAIGWYAIVWGLLILAALLVGVVAIELLTVFFGALGSLSEFNFSELSTLPFAIFGALLILGLILRYIFSKVKFPSIFLPEFLNAFAVLEKPEFFSYLKNHYRITIRDTAYLQRMSKNKQYLEKINNRVSIKMQESISRKQEADRIARKNFEACLDRDIEKKFADLVKGDFLTISKEKLFHLGKRFELPYDLPKDSALFINVVLIKLKSNSTCEYALILKEDVTIFNFDVFTTDHNPRSDYGMPRLHRDARFGYKTEELSCKKSLKILRSLIMRDLS